MRLYGVSLGEGNAKVGEVFTFSLPSKTTCPGASAWCLKRCYAFRYEQRRPKCREAYEDNLVVARDPRKFTRTMIGILPRIMSSFRIHVSGDFMSRDYISSWVRICQAFPRTRFWGYTRSWIVPELRSSLTRLRELTNVQLLASTDVDMPLPPQGWRVAFVNTDPRANGVLCSAQLAAKGNCQACGYCFNPGQGNVVFKVH